MSARQEPAVNLQALADQLKVLSDPTRLAVLDLLMHGVQCNCELSQELQLAPNLISHHLGVLAQSGLVDTERDASDARWVYYSVSEKALDNLRMALAAFCDPTRIKPRRPNCGPPCAVAAGVDLAASES